MLKQSLLLILLITATRLIAAPAMHLDPTETLVNQYVAQHTEQQLALLEKLVNINSGTANLEGVRRVGELLIPQFQQLGFTTTWVKEPDAMHRAPTLVAERHGTQGKRLLLIGHLDTVAAKDAVIHFERRGERAFGQGVVDDKGGDVVILFALKALQAAHALDHTSITVVLTGDEEDSGKPTSISRRPLFDAAKQNDIALDFEDAVSDNTASITRRGIALWKLTTQGKEAHSSAIFQPSVGAGAIFELSRILDSMRMQLSSEQYLSFSPGITLGGTSFQYDSADARGTVFGKGNVIAQTAFAQGDLRYLSEEQKNYAENRIQAIVLQHLPDTKASIVFQDGIAAMPPTDGNRALLEQYSQASQDLGLGKVVALDPLLRGAGDISHIASMMSANLVGLGPLGSDEHSAKESLEIYSLPMQTRRAALLIYRLTR